MRKRRLLLVAGACLATLSLGVGTALADPVPGQPPFRALQGVGSDTTQDVMNAFANGTNVFTPAFPGIKDGAGNFVIASWDAIGSATITTKDPATFPQCSNIPRPNGSGDGINAIVGLKPGFPMECADFARSSADDHTARPGQGLTYIPFAIDAVTYATLTQSNVPKNFTQAQLTTIFQRDNTPTTPCIFKPRVPQINSGTRNFWRQNFGFPISPAHPTGFGTCVETPETTTHAAGGIITGCSEEHDGCMVSSVGPTGGSVVDPNVIFPYGVGPWTAQATNRNVQDRRGLAIIRGIDGIPPWSPTFPKTRPVFNVIKTANIGVQPFASTFVGPGSQICQHPDVIESQGFSPNPDCGSTTIQTP